MSFYQVNRCVCHNISFKEILDRAEELQLTELSDLRDAGICSNNCRMCEPYIEMALESGRCSFEPGEYLRYKEEAG